MTLGRHTVNDKIWVILSIYSVLKRKGLKFQITPSLYIFVRYVFLRLLCLSLWFLLNNFIGVTTVRTTIIPSQRLPSSLTRPSLFWVSTGVIIVNYRHIEVLIDLLHILIVIIKVSRTFLILSISYMLTSESSNMRSLIKGQGRGKGVTVKNESIHL